MDAVPCHGRLRPVFDLRQQLRFNPDRLVRDLLGAGPFTIADIGRTRRLTAIMLALERVEPVVIGNRNTSGDGVARLAVIEARYDCCAPASRASAARWCW